MKAVVVIFGNAAHGKTTFGRYVSTALGDKVWRRSISFATPLKEIASILLGTPNIKHFSQEFKEKTIVYGKSVRKWLQWLGTEVGREQVHQDVWIHRFCDTVKQMFSDDPWSKQKVVICSDGRFVNELQLPKEFLGEDVKVINVRIVRPDYPVDLSHPSESVIHDLDDKLFDVVIQNKGTQPDLQNEAEIFVETLLTPTD